MQIKRKRLGSFRLDASGDDTAYLRLPTYPAGEAKMMSKSTGLFDYIGKYEGPDVVFDFDEDGVLVGVEFWQTSH